MEELVRRLSGGKEGISLFALLPQWWPEREPGFSYADQLKKEGFSEGTVGAVQTFFFRAEDGPCFQAAIHGPQIKLLNGAVAGYVCQLNAVGGKRNSRSAFQAC